ncbi:DUF6415 family natural product biosynthesis protein [Streptomyces sp. 7R015]|uniref:DUF6415 family natural product biosynthesis protein n=2 Tax=Streptomyces cylindrosporus TaxID=2927583 RepID=A0ABS9YM91_9ACTN|nr:DUF6415 family natural product biosynthesis protein [Streptomyces cylindrosporus]
MPDVLPPAADELEDLALRLRGHLSLLAPEVEELALAPSADSVLRCCALACVGEARGKLRAAPPPGPNGAAAYARRLARTLDSLCEHYEKLGGGGICPACDRPIMREEPSVLTDYLSPSGPTARSIRIHARCANTVRRR